MLKVRTSVTLIVLGMAGLAVAGCRSEPPPARPPVIIAWREIASWKGRGDAQLDMFSIDGWNWRIRWETKNEAPQGTGTFHVEPHSADSGRLLADPIEARGAGHDTAYFSIVPHRYYLVVDSKNVDWSMTVEEGILSAP